MKNKQEYDIIFSMGAACSCSQAIRLSNLQIYSYPFDWLFGNNFIGRCDILTTKFDRFIDKNDLEYSFEERSIKCTAYHNKYNDLTFNHDFLKEIPFDNAYKDVKEKYDRRIKRLLSSIECSKNVLGCYIETPNSKDIKYNLNDIINCKEKLNTTFPNTKFDLLYIVPDNSLKHGEFKYNFFNGVYYIIANYSSKNKNDPPYAPDFNVLKNILQQYKLKISFYLKVKKTFKKVLVSVIPIKSIRKKLKKKYHL